MLKKYIKQLLSISDKDAQIYIYIKNLIITCIKEKYLKMNEPSNRVRKTISDCLTIIIISGIFYHWKTCINDLITECTSLGNLEYKYVVLRALGSIDLLIHYNREISTEENYEDSIKISQKEKIQIKDKLIENKDIVINFILYIFKDINNFKNEEFRKTIVTQLLDTTKCWTNFELNLLKSEKISNMVYFIADSNILENPENFSNMIIDTIKNSNNCKIYRTMVVDRNSTPEQLSQKLFNLIDQKERSGLDLLLNFILPKLENLKMNPKLDDYGKKLLKEYAKILSSIIENYIYFFFNFSDEKSAIILKMLSDFLTIKQKSISILFFEGINEMREFINNFYRFSGLNNKQKIDFVNYLMGIVYGVMENCSYTKLDQKDISLLEQEILCRNISLSPEPPKSLSSLSEYQQEFYDNCNIDEDIDVNQYRLNAESVFYNIFLILIDNFQDPGTSQFLNKLLSILELDQMNEERYLNNPLSAIKIDVVFFVISSIIEIFEVEEAPNSINIIHNLVNLFLGAKIVFQNQRIFIDFLILINKFSQKLIIQQENFNKVLQFLLLVSKKSNNENIIESCYIVLLNICNEISSEIKIDNIFIQEIYNLYQAIYNKYHYPNIKPLQNIIDIIFTLYGISQNIIRANKINPNENKNFNPNLINVIQQISYPINNEIKNLLEKFENNNQDAKLKSILRFEIIKGYLLQGRILELLKKYSIELRNKFLEEHLNFTLNLNKKIFQIFQDDEDVINSLIKFYLENASAIGGNCLKYFNEFNNIMINYYLSSENHFKVLDILRLFYLSFLLSFCTNDKSYILNNKFILDQYCLIMDTFINNISKINNINITITEKIKTIADFHHYIFPKLSLNSPLIIQDKQEVIKYYNLIQRVINFFQNCIKLFQNLEIKESVDELTLISIIKCFNSFLLNITLSKDFLTQKNNNNSCIIADLILAIWNIIVFKQFNCSARKTLINYYNIIIQYDINLFNFAFEKCLSQSNKFSPIYIKSILEYFQCFRNDSKDINEMLEPIIENVQGTEELDAKKFGYLFSLVARKKGLKKVNK
jgi:hypothetical protein